MSTNTNEEADATSSRTVTARPTEPLLVSMREGARALGISERFARLLAARGDLPSVRLGRRRLLRRNDIDGIVARGGLMDAE
jgi:excisionase family DNA binding protein